MSLFGPPGGRGRGRGRGAARLNVLSKKDELGVLMGVQKFKRPHPPKFPATSKQSIFNSNPRANAGVSKTFSVASAPIRSTSISERFHIDLQNEGASQKIGPGQKRPMTKEFNNKFAFYSSEEISRTSTARSSTAASSASSSTFNFFQQFQAVKSTPAPRAGSSQGFGFGFPLGFLPSQGPSSKEAEKENTPKSHCLKSPFVFRSAATIEADAKEKEETERFKFVSNPEVTRKYSIEDLLAIVSGEAYIPEEDMFPSGRMRERWLREQKELEDQNKAEMEMDMNFNFTGNGNGRREREDEASIQEPVKRKRVLLPIDMDRNGSSSFCIDDADGESSFFGDRFLEQPRTSSPMGSVPLFPEFGSPGGDGLMTENCPIFQPNSSLPFQIEGMGTASGKSRNGDVMYPFQPMSMDTMRSRAGSANGSYGTRPPTVSKFFTSQVLDDISVSQSPQGFNFNWNFGGAQ